MIVTPYARERIRLHRNLHQDLSSD
uniref:Uncharacterized protein n=1 Tax=Zea mays TaxID=4577 RepID=B4FW13_MAIZE|nr:unknown [Zea mays]